MLIIYSRLSHCLRAALSDGNTLKVYDDPMINKYILVSVGGKRALKVQGDDELNISIRLPWQREKYRS
jgi:hypothetical protein